MVEGEGVLCGVGPGDADGGGGAFFEGFVGVELGQGVVPGAVWWEVVGGVEALAVGQEGQAVGDADGARTAVLAAGAGEGLCGVFEPGG